MTLPAATALAQEILKVARKAHSEEDVRVGVERALGTTLKALGLHAAPEYEKTTLSGTADAVYGHLVIEYKRPGRLAERGFVPKLAEQIGRYLLDMAQEAGSGDKCVEALEKLVGIGLDGEQILFMHYSPRRRRRPALQSLSGPSTWSDAPGCPGGFDRRG